jgi:HK97 family phage prohead protease
MKEIRIAELRAIESPVDDNALILEGRPLVYDQPTVIKEKFGSFTEVIRAGALGGADLSDTRLLYNHDLSRIPLARTPKTMQLSVDQAGLRMVALLPDTEQGREVYTAVRRGDLSGMSMAFVVDDGGSHYDPKTNTRTITKIKKILECSIVPFPAYPQTSVEARAEIKGAWDKLNDPARKALIIRANRIRLRSVDI